MEKTLSKSQTIRAARRLQIAQAALKVFSLRSFEGAQMTDIAKEANISHGLIYHYFKDKQEIFDFAERQSSEELLKVIENISLKDWGFEEKFTQLADFFLNEKKSDKNFAYRFFAAVSKKLSDSGSRSAHNIEVINTRKKTRGHILSIFSEGENCGMLAGGLDAKSASELFWALAVGSNLGSILKPDKKSQIDTQSVKKLFLKEKHT